MANLTETPAPKNSFRSKIQVPAHVPGYPRFIEVHEQKDGEMQIMCYIESFDNCTEQFVQEAALCSHSEVKAAIEQTTFTGPW